MGQGEGDVAGERGVHGQYHKLIQRSTLAVHYTKYSGCGYLLINLAHVGARF